MAGANYVLSKGWVATEALEKYTFVTLDAAETVSAADAQGEKPIGVVQETISAADATGGRVANVAIMGISRVIAGATIAIGANVTVGADARAEVAIAGDVVCGFALQAAVDGDHMDVFLTPTGLVV